MRQTWPRYTDPMEIRSFPIFLTRGYTQIPPTGGRGYLGIPPLPKMPGCLVLPGINRREIPAPATVGKG